MSRALEAAQFTAIIMIALFIVLALFAFIGMSIIWVLVQSFTWPLAIQIITVLVIVILIYGNVYARLG